MAIYHRGNSNVSHMEWKALMELSNSFKTCDLESEEIILFKKQLLHSTRKLLNDLGKLSSMLIAVMVMVIVAMLVIPHQMNVSNATYLLYGSVASYKFGNICIVQNREFILPGWSIRIVWNYFLFVL